MSNPGFLQKYSACLSDQSSYDSFLGFLENLNLKDWEELLGVLVEDDDSPLTRGIISPPLGVASLTYLGRLVRQASPHASRLAGMALASITRRRINSRRSRGRERFLIRALDFAGQLDVRETATVLEDIAFDRTQELQVRLQSAFALSDIQPEKLNPIGLGDDDVSALAPAILAAARGKSSEWLDCLLFLDIELPDNVATSIEYPLGAALRDYEQVRGVSGVGALISQVSPSSWIWKALTTLLEIDPELVHLKKFRKPDPGTESSEEQLQRSVRELRSNTRKARFIWEDTWVPIDYAQKQFAHYTLKHLPRRVRATEQLEVSS